MIFQFDTSFQERKVLSAAQVCPHFKSLPALDSHFGYQDIPPIASVVINQIHTLGSNSFYSQDSKELA